MANTEPVMAAVERVGAQFKETASDLSTRLGTLEQQWDRFSSSPAYRGDAANDNGLGRSRSPTMRGR
jgi:hypothetical protein